MTSATSDATTAVTTGRPRAGGAPAVGPELDSTLLRLLGEPLRARIVSLLAVEQLCTCHLVELTGASQTNISNHLRGLRDAGVVTAEPHGRFTYYRLVPDALQLLGGQLAHLTSLAAAATKRRPCS